MGIILILFFWCFTFLHQPCLFFFMYLHRSYGIVRIYLVLIAYSTSTHLVFEAPLLQYIPLLEMYTEIALGKVYTSWGQHRCTHHITYIFSVLCSKRWK